MLLQSDEPEEFGFGDVEAVVASANAAAAVASC